MGLLAATELAEKVRSGALPLYSAMHIHLTCNHHPPLNEVWTQIAIAIVERYKDDQDLDYSIEHPLRPGTQFSAAKIVEDLHLAAFLQDVGGN